MSHKSARKALIKNLGEIQNKSKTDAPNAELTQFYKFCRNGDLIAAKNFRVLHQNMITRLVLIKGLTESCQINQFEIAKWLYNLGADIHADNDYAFKVS